MPPVAQSHTSVHASAASRGATAAPLYGLDLMLMDGALERIARARGEMEEGENPENDELLREAVVIVGELRSTLDVYGGGPYAVNLDDLCDYMSRQLVAANLQNRIATLDEVSHLLREARSAWVTLTYV